MNEDPIIVELEEGNETVTSKEVVLSTDGTQIVATFNTENGEEIVAEINGNRSIQVCPECGQVHDYVETEMNLDGKIMISRILGLIGFLIWPVAIVGFWINYGVIQYIKDPDRPHPYHKKSAVITNHYLNLIAIIFGVLLTIALALYFGLR